MGKYKHIRKKTKSSARITDQAEQAKHWLQEHMEHIALTLGAVVLLAAIGYGVIYYRNVTINDSSEKLYLATSLVHPVKGTNAQADAAIREARRLIAEGGPDVVIAQAHINIGILLARKSEFDEAVKEFDLAMEMEEKGSLLYEIALVVKANALFRSGKADEAATYYRILSETAKNYPRSDALFSLGLSLAKAGKKDDAIGALNLLKASYPSYLPEDFIDDTIRHIEADVFIDVLSPQAAITEAPGKTDGVPKKIGPSTVHTGAGK
ncbi:hypothetical protein MNBD_NITROSPINAE02-1868 [hydrothermal vent metagenome]|uniref:Uncharacterized protein n=1 Tax=hydrothermal vent metagenome TaxID=652676 RepID=A0A3B1CK90_9ZZZZ